MCTGELVAPKASRHRDHVDWVGRTESHCRKRRRYRRGPVRPPV